LTKTSNETALKLGVVFETEMHLGQNIAKSDIMKQKLFDVQKLTKNQ